MHDEIQRRLMAEFDRRIFQLLQEAIPQMSKPIDKDYELMRLLSPAVEWARDQYATPREHAGWPNHRADERCRDLLESLLHHECAGMGCSSTSACSPECEASFTSRDPNKEAEWVEQILAQPREAIEILTSKCGECGKDVYLENYDCPGHQTELAEVVRDVIALLETEGPG